MPFRTVPDEQFAVADKLVNEDGLSIREAAKQSGISAGTLYKRYKTQDPKPGGRRTVKATKASATDEQLVSLFSKIAVAPAVPAGLWLHCDFCANHFVTQGPEAARKLVELSHNEPALRRVLEWVYGYAQEVAWATILATWLGIPLAHHLTPDFIYQWIAGPLGLPPRGAPVTPAPNSNGHVHNEAAPGPMPFAGMDIDSLLGMAKAFGIEVELPTDIIMNDMPTGEDATATAEADATAEAAADSTAPVETATADTDADE